VPFEVLETCARQDSFELAFTKAAHEATVEDPKSHAVRTFTYIFQAAYGSSEVDATLAKIVSIEASEDGPRARIVLDDMKMGNIHELKLAGIRSAEGRPPLHPAGWYTLWNLPKE